MVVPAQGDLVSCLPFLEVFLTVRPWAPWQGALALLPSVPSVGGAGSQSWEGMTMVGMTMVGMTTVLEE